MSPEPMSLRRLWKGFLNATFAPAFVILFASPLPCLADQSIIALERDPVEHYGSRILGSLLILGICLLLYSLIRHKGRATRPGSWGLLVLGVGILPVISVAFGGMLVLERAARPEFCGSCHMAMKAYLEDLRDPASDSLAAIHYKNRYIPTNQCYVCHTSYGLFGTFQAKVAGIIDVYRYYTGTYSFPIRMRTAYPNDDCLKCHAGAVKWIRTHRGLGEAVFRGETGCQQCHGILNPPHRLERRG